MTPRSPMKTKRRSSAVGASDTRAHIAFRVNGEDAEVSFAPYKTLLDVLREDLGLMGTKHGCELGECGACAVLVDGEPVLSCLVLGLECGGREVVTVEGIDENGRLHPLQEAFADLGAAQCGYCTPGILLTAKALLERHPVPTRQQIQEALSGNICRCTGYLQIFEAVEAAILEIGATSERPAAVPRSERSDRERDRPERERSGEPAVDGPGPRTMSEAPDQSAPGQGTER